ncbi:MAG: DNA/RNA non-specific endonuclease [Microscillaceae bacterium]|jgi:endonuclease G|nr:DNA/RNA non-specific endonuclease [Microscillaceae bacterium]
MQFRQINFYLLLVLWLMASACEEIVNPDQAARINHLELGNPSEATASVSNSENYLIRKPQFVLSYSRNKGSANWVSWHLSKAWQGNTDRQDDFRADLDVPSEWGRVTASDYSGSGFDRGHLCPSADRTLNATDNSSTFVMSNMIPQSPDNNRGPWAQLEEYTRSVVNNGAWEAYVTAGGYGRGGTGANGYQQTIQNGKILVPAYTWKVIVILPIGDNDLRRINTNTRVIAVAIPNRQDIRTKDWRLYRVSVDDLEATTGYDFLSEVADNIQNVIERQIDVQ